MAVDLDPELPLAHAAIGNLLMRRNEFDEAVRWAERAVVLGPNDPDNYAMLANIYSFVGRGADAVELMLKAIEFDPNYSPRYGMYLGRAYLLTRQPEAAIPYLRDAAIRAPDFWPPYLFLAGAYAHLGRRDEAVAALAAMRQYVKLDSIAEYFSVSPIQPGPERDFLVEGLALAGLPRE
jgi:tetratricopeptide (TPR) repeat protein